MGFVFKINEELSAIAVTATELSSISRNITNLVQNSAFIEQLNDIVAEITQSYGVVSDSFSPFYELVSEQDFEQRFDALHEAFKASYLADASKPRRYCENVYDAYIQLQQTKEAKSRFPLLKRNIERLDKFYDKWITNDNLLAMSIDGVLKLQNRLLNEIAEIKQKDIEDAYIIFSSAFDDFRDYLTLIQSKTAKVSEMVTPASISARTG
jgi:archaellum component FlaC